MDFFRKLWRSKEDKPAITAGGIKLNDKRRRFLEPLPASIHTLPDAVLQVCLSFVGKGHYFYVAAVDRRFRKLYQQDHAKKTKWSAAGSSVPCAKLAIQDAKDQGRDENKALGNSVHGAINVGCLEVLEWAHSNGFDFWSNTGKFFFVKAVLWKNVNVLRWADAKGLEWCSEYAIFVIVRYSLMEPLEYAYESGKELYAEKTAVMAAKLGQLSVIQWFKKKGLFHVNENTWLASIFGGHVHVLDWFFHDGHRPSDDFILMASVRENQRECILWARNHGFHCDVNTCAFAAQVGNLPLLQWLRENDFGWDGRVFGNALDAGHLDIVRWAFANGCPMEILPWHDE